MKTLNTKVSIPSPLHEFHGKQASVIDLLLTYAIAAFTTIIILHLAGNAFTEIYEFLILGILAFDLSGGIVSNFTKGTTTYYRENPKARTIFIALHVIQPLAMIWLFPDTTVVIATLSIYTLLALLIVNSMQQPVNQRVLAAFFTTLGIPCCFLFEGIHAVAQLLLLLFLVKLPLAFAVRW